jgi:hypothetical protein
VSLFSTFPHILYRLYLDWDLRWHAMPFWCVGESPEPPWTERSILVRLGQLKQKKILACEAKEDPGSKDEPSLSTVLA